MGVGVALAAGNGVGLLSGAAGFFVTLFLASDFGSTFGAAFVSVLGSDFAAGGVIGVCAPALVANNSAPAISDMAAMCFIQACFALSVSRLAACACRIAWPISASAAEAPRGSVQ